MSTQFGIAMDQTLKWEYSPFGLTLRSTVDRRETFPLISLVNYVVYSYVAYSFRSYCHYAISVETDRINRWRPKSFKTWIKNITSFPDASRILRQITSWSPASNPFSLKHVYECYSPFESPNFSSLHVNIPSSQEIKFPLLPSRLQRGTRCCWQSGEL